VQWSRKGYDTAGLEKLYTGNDARVNLVLQQLADKLANPQRMRALGFCVSIAHAEFMADRFSKAGLPSEAISATTDSETRKASLLRLQAGELRALFAVDIFNEGVDLPAVDTLLFLRPTESPVVFMQQLGRGLRRSEDKACVTVLDFIGEPIVGLVDARYRAITGASRMEVEEQIRLAFHCCLLAAQCSWTVSLMNLLANLRTAILTRE
jgi:superfamily II DNA or RNA helicase